MTTLYQLQAFWDQPVAFAPRTILAGETFHCFDLTDLRDMRDKLAGKANVVVYRIERDGADIMQQPIDLDDLISEQAAERAFDDRAYHREQARAAV